MKVYKITDVEFQEYGMVLSGYNFNSFLQALSTLPIPDMGITYEASVKILEDDKEFPNMKARGFGGMPIQIGYVGGNNKMLNCLEYHKSSEFNIALDDVVLVLGKQTEMNGNTFDTSLCKAFLVPAGVGVELFATTLHYAPMNVGEKGYRVACVLPLGTNAEKPKLTVLDGQDKLCAGSNKWLLAHPDSKDVENGAYIGLKGKNISFNDIKL